MLAERTAKEIFIIIIHYLFFNSCHCTASSFSVDIWVANQGDIAANEKRLSITVLDKVNALITMKMNVQEL